MKTLKYIPKKASLTALLIFITGSIISLFLFTYFDHIRESLDRQHFNTISNQIEESIRDRMRIYDDALRSGVALFAASNVVEADEWNTFITSLQIDSRYPGILGIGVVTRFLEDHLEDATLLKNKKIKIHSIDHKNRNEHFIITYVEPLDKNKAAIGLDLASEVHRRNAAIKSRDTGEAAATELIDLVQLSGDDKKGFLYYLPLYKKDMPRTTLDDREKAHFGFVYAPFSAKIFFGNILSNASNEIDVDIYDGDEILPKNWLYSKDVKPEHSFIDKRDLYIGGKKFTLTLNKSESFRAEPYNKIWIIMILSLFISLSLAVISYMIQIELHHKTELNREIDQKYKATHEKLLQSQKMESLGQLVSGITHDFNNVLGGIIANASRIKSASAQNSSSIKHADNILLSANLGASLMKDLLTFTRKSSPLKKATNINKLIEDATRIAAVALQKNIELKTNLQSNLWEALADSSQLTQVILNLCINARDAMPEGGSIFIKTENKILKENNTWTDIPLESGCYVHIEVQDTGSGIPLEIREKIFEPFFTTKGEGKGTGLGLSMVASIIEDHKGKIFLDMNTKQGTLFHILLPVSSTLSDQPEKLLTSDAPIAAR